MAKTDIKVGDRFGKLTVIREVEPYFTPSHGKTRQFDCQCDCGRIITKNLLQLRRTPYCKYCKHDNPYIADLDGEEWRDIKGYEGLYQVSNKGRVKSLIKETSLGNRIKVHPEKILKPSVGKRGYWVVGLSKNGKTLTKTLHRLLADAFIPNPDNKPFIDHIDTDKLNCAIENLRWVTSKENTNNPRTLVNMKRATKMAWEDGKFDERENVTFRRVAQYDRQGNLIKEWDSVIDVERTIHVDGSSISAVCLGKRKSAGGYVWKHIGERYNPRLQ